MGKSAWDDIDNVGNNLRHAVHKNWAQSELKKADPNNGWMGSAWNTLANEGWDAAAAMTDSSTVTPDPYAERYRMIETALKNQKSGEKNPSDVRQLIDYGWIKGR